MTVYTQYRSLWAQAMYTERHDCSGILWANTENE